MFKKILIFFVIFFIGFSLGAVLDVGSMAPVRKNFRSAGYTIIFDNEALTGIVCRNDKPFNVLLEIYPSRRTVYRYDMRSGVRLTGHWCSHLNLRPNQKLRDSVIATIVPVLNID